jgi:hypothetical protein
VTKDEKLASKMTNMTRPFLEGVLARLYNEYKGIYTYSNLSSRESCS